MFIRTRLVASGKKVRDLHKEAIGFVKASAQADILRQMQSELTSKEKDIVRYARNAKVNSIPKNADIEDYHYSTGFEALIGYLYLSKQNDRLNEILVMAYEIKNTSLS